MGLKEWAEKNTVGGETTKANKAKHEAHKAGLRAGHTTTKAKRGNVDTFEGVALTSDSITYKDQGGSVKGAVARVESSADAERRVTATRLLTLGVFAFAAKKQKGNIYLTVEHPDYEFVVEISVKKESKAREFASKINTAAKSGS